MLILLKHIDKKINRASSDQTRKWIEITFTLTTRLRKKNHKNLFLQYKRNPFNSSSYKYQLILGCKEHPVSSYLKFKRGKIYD